MTQPDDDPRVTWVAGLTPGQVLTAINGHRITQACGDCGGTAVFRLTVDAGWTLWAEHELSCPHLRKVKAEVGGAG